MANEYRTNDEEVMASMIETMGKIAQYKPGDRTEKDGRYAVTSMMIEQALAYFMTFVVMQVTNTESNDESN